MEAAPTRREDIGAYTAYLTPSLQQSPRPYANFVPSMVRPYEKSRIHFPRIPQQAGQRTFRRGQVDAAWHGAQRMAQAGIRQAQSQDRLSACIHTYILHCLMLSYSVCWLSQPGHFRSSILPVRAQLFRTFRHWIRPVQQTGGVWRSSS